MRENKRLNLFSTTRKYVLPMYLFPAATFNFNSKLKYYIYVQAKAGGAYEGGRKGQRNI